MGFEEWYEKVGVVKHYIYVNEKWIAKIGFEAGAASRQAEVDKLKSDHQLAESQLGYACVKWRDVAENKQADVESLQDDLIKAAEGQMKLFEHNNELQNLIDEALDFLHASNHYNEYYVSQAIKILKGV